MNRYRIQVGYSGVVDFVVTTDAELDPNAVDEVDPDRMDTVTARLAQALERPR
jgi:hypothetical protein